MMRKLAVLSILVICSSYVYAQPDQKVWTRLAGTGGTDDGFAVAADPSGNCIIAGEAQGALFGSYQGARDMFIAKYDTEGNLLWGRQRGTSERDCAYGVATDSSGNIYATGYTGADLDGQSHAGGKWDIFFMKFSPIGEWLWTKQIGTGSDDEGYAVTTDASGNVYLTGYVRGDIHGQTRVGLADVIICKYNSAGTRLWTRLFGSTEVDQAWAIACDASANVFVSGYTYGSIEGNPFLASADLFLAKYDTNGNRLWLKQWGTWNAEHGYSLAADSAGNVYLSGYTTGTLYGPKNGGRDVFLAKFDAAGNELWGRQFGCTPGLGTNEHDQGWGVAMGADGNVYLAGQVEGPFDDHTYMGGLDIFLAKYNPAGTRLWSIQLGTPANDAARGGVATTPDGVSFLGGTTFGHLDGNTNNGSSDAFAMKFAPAPPPTPLTVGAGPDKQILLGRSTTLEGTVSGGTPPYFIEWSPAEGLDNPGLLQPTASPTVTTTYTLTVTDSMSESDSDSVLVTVFGSGIPADLDGDLDVDQSDFGLLQRCFAGPGVPQNDAACMGAKLDDDDDVDADDLVVFRDCFSGPNIPGDPQCAGPFPPAITQDPVSQSVNAGQTAVFTVSASGTTPLNYQWQKNQVNLSDGGNISGSTTHTLQVSNVQPSDEGDYRCIVTNNYGSATSNAATLDVTYVPPDFCFTNSDLETFTSGVATDWTACGDAAAFSASTDRYSGNYSQEIKWTSAGTKVSAIYQHVWVEVGVPYTVQAYFRMNNMTLINGTIRVDYNGGTNPYVSDIGASAPRLEWGSKTLTFTKTTGTSGWATVFVGGYGNAVQVNDWCRVDLVTPACTGN